MIFCYFTGVFLQQRLLHPHKPQLKWVLWERPENKTENKVRDQNDCIKTGKDGFK